MSSITTGASPSPGCGRLRLLPTAIGGRSEHEIAWPLGLLLVVRSGRGRLGPDHVRSHAEIERLVREQDVLLITCRAFNGELGRLCRRLGNVATSLGCMTLHERYEVGVRELHDRLSEHLDRVERGADIVVTRRGRPIARLAGVTGEDPLDELARRGLITPPALSRREKRARVKPGGSVSDLVAEPRR